MDKYERLQYLEDAETMVYEARQLVDLAIHDLGIKSNYEAYGRYGFDMLLGHGNPYDSSLNNIREYIENYLDEEE